MRIDNVIPDSQEINNNFMNENPLEECMFNSLYNEDLDKEELNEKTELIEIVLSLSKENDDDLRSNEVKVQEVEKISKGLILKELSKNLKYAFLGEEKSKPVIIATDLTTKKEKEVVEILIKHEEAIA